MTENIRNRDFWEEMNAMISERDYAEALKENFDREIQSEAFVFKQNL